MTSTKITSAIVKFPSSIFHPHYNFAGSGLSSYSLLVTPAVTCSGTYSLPSSYPSPFPFPRPRYLSLLLPLAKLSLKINFVIGHGMRR
jgi:hypothetical protein